MQQWNYMASQYWSTTSLVLPPSQSSSSHKRGVFSSNLIVQPFGQMKHVSKWVVISEQTHYHSPQLLQPDWDHIRQQGPGVVFASHHTEVLKHMDKGNMFNERKGRSQRLRLLSLHVIKGWTRRCHFTEEMQMGRWLQLVGQDSWGRSCDDRESFTCLPIPPSPPDTAMISTDSSTVQWYKHNQLPSSRYLINGIEKRLKK